MRKRIVRPFIRNSGYFSVFLLLLIGTFCFFGDSSSALTYQSTTDVSFTFGSTISVDVSSDTLSINNLNPGSSSDSNIITVSVATNASHGYTLTATAGTSSTNTDLVNTDNNNYKFSSIATNASLASLTADNTWGYSISTNNGTNWSNYSGLPKDNDDDGATGKELINTNNPADSRSIQFKIGAKASSAQAAGTYTNVINFYAVANAEPEEPPLMQSMTLADCGGESPVEVTDVRDSETYLVQQLADGNCWMLDNLRLDPTAVSLANLQGNTNASNQTLTYFKNGGGSSPYPATGVNTTWASSSDNKYNEPKVVTTYKDTTTTSYGAGSGKIGVYYNFCAASAGSYCYPSSSSTGDATEDLCPAGWRMPTGGSSGEYQALYTAYSSDATNFRNALSTPLSGYFYGGSADGQGDYGYFWSSTRTSNSVMGRLYVDDSSVYPAGRSDRASGTSVRCVLK